MKVITVDKENENQRIDKLVRKYLNLAPMSFVYKIFRKKDVKVNNHWVKENYIVKYHDEIKIYVTDEQVESFNKPKEISLVDANIDIVYEDENIIILNKPKGLLVVEDSSKSITLTDMVQSYLLQKGSFVNDGISYKPSPVHRLDRNTSGLCIFAKTLASSQILLDVFKKHEEIDKYYLTLVLGTAKKNGRIDVPLCKNETTKTVKVSSLSEGGKTAITEYSLLDHNEEVSLLKVHLLTGRTHQIRVHMAYNNTPIIGDAKYGNFDYNRIFGKRFKYTNQFLHSYKIVFGNLSGNLAYLSGKSFVADFPLKERNILRELNLNYFINKI